MTWSGYTAGRKGLRFTYWLEIHGLEPVFTRRTIAPAALVGSRTQHVTLMDAEPGETRLDVVALRQHGASLRVRLRDTNSLVLQSLFTPRIARTTFLVANAAISATTITVKSTANLDASGTGYLNGETITWTGKTTSPDTITGVTRAKWGSRAQAHYGGPLNGADLYLSPVSWVGRRVTLKGAYLNDANEVDGSTSDYYETIGTYRLEGPPQFDGDGTWTLDMGELTEFFSSQRAYVGLREVKPKPGDSLIAVGGAITLDESEARQFWLAQQPPETYVRITNTDDEVMVARLNARASTYIEVDSNDPGLIVGTSTSWANREVEIASLQHVAHLSGSPSSVLLPLLTSVIGDYTNGNYDVLPGRPREVFGAEAFRMGAAIDEDDIDIAAFEEIGGLAAPTWTAFLDEPISVKDLLEEFCRCTRSFWYVTTAGVLTVARLTERSTVSTALGASAVAATHRITDAVLKGNGRLSIEQGPVAHSITVSANYDPFRRQHLYNNTVVDWEMLDQFPESHESRSFAYRMIGVDVSSLLPPSSAKGTLRRVNPIQESDLLVMSRRMQQASAKPRLIYDVDVSWKNIAIVPGDTVVVTNSRVPDMKGGTLDEAHFLVVGRRIHLDAPIVSLRLMALEPGFRLAPVAIVTAWDGGTLTATVSTTDDTVSALNDPGSDFARDWQATILQTSTSLVEVETIAGSTSSTITLSAAPAAFTIAAGDLIFPSYTDDQTRNTQGLRPDDFTFQVSDDEVVTGMAIPSRWS